MAGNTPKLKLRQPNYTDFVQVLQDIDSNFQIIDDCINANIYTSSTRPTTNVYIGRMIYESDTKLLAIYLGVTKGWVYCGGANFAKGKRAVVLTTTDSSQTTGAEIGPYLSVSFTSESARRYWIETQYWLNYTGAALGISGHPRVRWATGATVTTAGTQIGSDVIANVPWQGGAEDHYKLYEFVPNIAGQITVGLFIQGGAVGGALYFDSDVDRASQLYVRDVGV